MSEHLGPLVLEPVFSERIWGAQSLPAPYPQPQPGKPIGEVWLTAENCRISNGAHAGQSLDQLAKAQPDALGVGKGTGFPLLMKVLLPHDKLSLQVHPDDAQAQLLGEPRGKTECWYVLHAEPGAELAVGLREGVTLDDVRTGISEGTMEDLMQQLPVKTGDMVFVDAGTIHAIGPGVVVIETQQYSDITYRLFDYGRPRELHVDQGLAVARTHTAAGVVKPRAMDGFTRLVESPYFVVDRMELDGSSACELGNTNALQILFALGPDVRLESEGGNLDLPQGYAVVLPAEGVAYCLRGTAQVIRALQPGRVFRQPA